MEGLDYSELLQAYSHLGRKPVVDPPTLFKIMVYAYSQGIYSTRKIEEACRRDINFMWLLSGQKCPDHNTINRFRSKPLENVLSSLFYQFIRKLNDLNEIKYENLFVDGTKIEANANKYTFVWKKSVNKHEARMQDKLRKFVDEINTRYNTNFSYTKNNISKLLCEIKNFLEKSIKEQGIKFIYGKGKRKDQLQKDTEKLNDFMEKYIKYGGYNKSFKGRNSFSKTDTDATFMNMKEDHMRNSQLKPGYNIHIGVENQYKVGVDVYSELSDQLTFIPFLERLKENTDNTYTNIIVDAGYESEEDYMYT